MCTRTCLWALAFTFTEALAAAQGAAGPGPAAALALEVELARTGAVYLLIDPVSDLLEIKSRGVVLDAVPLAGFALLGYRPARGAAPPAAVELPAVWTVTDDAAAAYRQVIAPGELRPFEPEAAEEEPPSTAVAEALPPPPASYRVGLDGGWALNVGPRLPSGGWPSRLRHAVGDGWARWRGRPVDERNLLAVAVAAEDAQRLHHLFRPEMKVLVVAPPPAR